MNDYIPIIKELLQQQYSTTSTGLGHQRMSTARILGMVRGIIPKNPVDEHDIFAVMQELGYRNVFHTVYQQDENGKPTENIDYQIYLWEMFPKNV